MSTNGKWLSKDGKWYDTSLEMLTANKAWREQQGIQEEQNRLIKEQNQLFEQQNVLNYQIEQERMQKNYELEMNKMKHEEKMRILNLFDDVGISKETYDDYITKNIFTDDNNKVFDKIRISLNNINDYNFLLKKRNFSNDEIDKYANQHPEVYDLEEQIKNKCYDKVSKDKLDEIEELKIKKNMADNFVSIFFIINIVLFFLNCIFSWSLLIWWLISLVPTIVTTMIFSKYDDKVKSLPEQIVNEKKYINKLNELILKENSLINKEIEILKVNNSKIINTFYDFRINHYNSSVEKLLIDVGFKNLVENLGIEYKKVNNSNKKKDGTIEDYIEYFETNS